ncbi:DUF3343 domain-containing protein [Alkaliphilus transvaalensis]|uniref:DUF3343 domain-containing protein n=1 Tax=Alkaliphilus transvaalensis TaxID=114628 RepID=UPI00047C4423|nr:DUF3343 domain-containing protein [Alkaliphilus transvaalensis]
MKNFYCVVTFHSTYHALNFEKVMLENGILTKLMPVPRQVSTSCGTAAEIPCEERQRISKICIDYSVEIAEIHKIEDNKKSNWFINLMNKV